MIPYILIIDGQIVGTTTDEDRNAYLKLPVPDGFTLELLDACVYDVNTNSVSLDPVAALAIVKVERIARIKTEAADRLAATDWQVERARERETTGYGSLADTALVLAERESIRQSSNAAEQAVEALTDVASVRAFEWTADVTVPAPRLLTHKQFADRFTDVELQAILAAADSNQALRAWWEKFKLARDINLDDTATQMGVNALEMAGLLVTGRASEIIT